MTELSKVGFSTDETVGNALLSAESRQEDDHFNWIDVMGNHDKLGLVLLDECGNVVETELQVDWLGSLATATFSFLLQTILLGGSSFGTVFREQFKQLGSLVLLDSVLELIDGGGHLQSLHQNPLLSLDSDVPWPLDETGEVSLWLNVSSESEVLRSLLEE